MRHLRRPIVRLLRSQRRLLHNSKLLDDRVGHSPALHGIVPSCAAGMGIGTYATVPTVLGPALCKTQGVVAQAAGDFTMTMLLATTTLMPLTAGATAVLLANHASRFGMRRLALFSSVVFPTGLFLVPACAASSGNFSIFAASYGLLGGVGFYATYHQVTPFLATRWFPGAGKGRALSIYFTCFGGAALVGVPLLRASLSYFRSPPTRLCGLDELSTFIGDHGQRIVELPDGRCCEVVAATARDLSASGFGGAGLEEGLFMLGSGSSGACETMALTGAGVFALMHAAAWAYRVPPKPRHDLHRGITSAASGTDREEGGAGSGEPREMSLAEATRTPHFYLLALGSLGISVTGLPFLHAGAFMIQDIFGGQGGLAAGSSAATAAAAFPALLKGGNVAGRIIWGPIADAVGPSRALMMLGAGVPFLLGTLSSPSLLAAGIDTSTALFAFQAGAVANCAIYAGVPLLIVPVAAQRFGSSCAAEVYWRTWIALPIANVLATGYLARARDASYKAHALRIANLCEDDAFAGTFGAAKDDADALARLVDSKTITIPMLLRAAPEGTPDPSPWLYQDTLAQFAVVGTLAIGCNIALFRLPLPPRAPSLACTPLTKTPS
jgi:MFS family permease